MAPALAQESPKSSPPDTTPYVRPVIPEDTKKTPLPGPGGANTPLPRPPKIRAPPCPSVKRAGRQYPDQGKWGCASALLPSAWPIIEYQGLSLTRMYARINAGFVRRPKPKAPAAGRPCANRFSLQRRMAARVLPPRHNGVRLVLGCIEIARNHWSPRRCQPSGGRMTQNRTPLLRPSCFGAQT
jgi:hypothetical protein